MQIYDIPIGIDRRETTPHGTPELPLAVYETVLARNVLGFVDWHWHSELQFMLVMAGQVSVSAGQAVFPLGAGAALFINANVLHSARPLTADAAYLCLDVHPSLLAAFPGSALDTRYLAPLLADGTRAAVALDPAAPRQSAALEQLRAAFREAAERGAGWELAVTARLLLLLRLLLTQAPAEQAALPDVEALRLRTLSAYIHAHYGERLTLAQLAAQVGLCESECCRFFKRRMGCTLFEYLGHVRVAKSAELLRARPRRSVSDVAYDCGFSSTSYYIRAFRLATGLTPGAYRRADIAS